MKSILASQLKTTTLLAFLLLSLQSAANPADSLTFEQILLELETEFTYSASLFNKKHNALMVRLEATDREITYTAGKHNKKYRRALETKLRLLDELALLEAQGDLGMLKVRYRKGIELIRLMYEKTLGLDHHFTGLHTYQHISTLSNPHTYPDFQQAQEKLLKHKNKKYHLKLPSLLESNPFISATFTLVSVLMGENSQKEKQAEVEKIACILDFTLRMNADLNTIRNETEFLKLANQALKEDCERLFLEYTKPVGYLVQLEDCRTNDDWESLFQKLDDLVLAIEEEMIAADGMSLASSRHLVNLEFATQRVIDFITQYSNFIGQGTQYYHKFDNIVNTYQHESACQEQLPRQFAEMKADIRATIDKFNNTYDLPELQGSRLKNLMYGVGE